MKNAIHYPKVLAKSETTSRVQHIEIRNEEGMTLSEKQAAEITKASYSLMGAYPYIFDALSYACTHHREDVERRDNKSETHYRVRFPIDVFFDFALNGKQQYTKSLMTELYDLASRSREKNIPKILPLNKDYSIRTTPIRIDFILKNGEKVSEQEKKRLAGLKGDHSLPLEFVVIEFYKPLFAPLLRGKYGEAWFSIPKAFYAETRNEIDIIRDTDILKGDTERVRVTPTQARKVFFYINLHDNKKGDTIRLDDTDFLLSCFPEHVNIKGDKKYIDRWWDARLKVKKALILFNSMAKKGLMNGSQFVPVGMVDDLAFDTDRVRYDKEKRQFVIKVMRGKKTETGRTASFPIYEKVPDFQITNTQGLVLQNKKEDDDQAKNEEKEQDSEAGKVPGGSFSG